MGIDIRIPMGLMFSLLGVILTIYGAITQFSNRAMYDKSLGINLNLWWGLVILIFGAVMLLLAWRSAKKTPTAEARKPDEHAQSAQHSGH